MSLLAFCVLASSVACASSAAPNIFLVVVDDFGWHYGTHTSGNASISSSDSIHPHMDQLVKEGVELNRHYVHPTCTPSRASIQTGRLPVHILTKLVGPCDTNGAIPYNMTGIASQLRRAGYQSHQVGKWDVGMATSRHTPQGRGYDTSLNYFSHGNWGWSEAEWLGSYNNTTDVPAPGIIDFWDTDRPASHLNGTGFEEYLFRDRMTAIIRGHAADNGRRRAAGGQEAPLFLQYDSKIAHYPMMAPLEYQKRFEKTIPEDHRRMYTAMIAFLDDQLLNVTTELKSAGLWDNTVMVLMSDNGGYVKSFEGNCNTTHGGDAGGGSDVGHGTACFNGEAGASNWPLTGGKYSLFEGGMRVNAFVSGGLVPDSAKGSRCEGIVHGADWYGTLCHMAGLEDCEDHLAAQNGLPPVDSVNVWPMISGSRPGKPGPPSPRTTILVSDVAIIHGDWKYIEPGTNMIEAASGGPLYPNASTASDPIDAHSFKCPPSGCLFNVAKDPEEKYQVAVENPAVVAHMKALLEEQAKTMWSQPHSNDPECRVAAYEKYGGFFGPWK